MKRFGIAIAGIGFAALLIGCDSENEIDRQARTAPESPLLLEPQSPLLTDYKEVRGRQARDVSPDGKFVLVGSADGANWAIEVLSIESGNVVGQMKDPGREVYGTPSQFLPGSNYVFDEEFIFKYTLWDFRRDRTVGCSTGTNPLPDRTVVVDSRVVCRSTKTFA